MTHQKPQLPYAADALAPIMSQETIDYHYGKHLQTYVDNLNRLIENTPYDGMSLDEIVKSSDGAIFNNAAQAWNHIFFFDTLSPQRKDIPASLVDVLNRDFGSIETFNVQFSKVAVSLLGSARERSSSVKPGPSRRAS